MKKILLWLWQLPQNILGLLVILFTGAHRTAFKGEWVASKWPHFGVSLGNYIIFGGAGGDNNSYYHELGHKKQSLYLGPLYLIIIGLPSILGNIFSHIEWAFSSKDKKTAERIVKWYYKQPWEAWADKLGGVKR
ncbi:MAG: hypothetical protein IKQ22_00965 [Clostridia bacterium]|nr:hypothetical protein [Clostridia bacterium]